MGFCRLRLLCWRIFIPLRVGRPHCLRNAAGQVGSEGDRLHLCGNDDSRSSPRHLRHHLRNGSENLIDSGLCGMHALRAGQRDCRSRSNQVHRQMVQGQEHGIRNGPPAGHSPSGNRPGPYSFADAGEGQGRRGNLHPSRDSKACILRTGIAPPRHSSLGRVRDDGCKIRRTERPHGQEGEERGGRIQILRHIQGAVQQALHNVGPALRLLLLQHYLVQEVRHVNIDSEI